MFVELYTRLHKYTLVYSWLGSPNWLYLLYDIIEYYMAIPENPEDKCSTVTVKLCGEAKKKVLAKKKEIRESGMACSNELAIIKLILAEKK